MCLNIAFGKLCVTLCGRFDPDEGGAAGYVDRIGGKYTAKWGVQIVSPVMVCILKSLRENALSKNL